MHGMYQQITAQKIMKLKRCWPVAMNN